MIIRSPKHILLLLLVFVYLFSIVFGQTTSGGNDTETNSNNDIQDTDLLEKLGDVKISRSILDSTSTWDNVIWCGDDSNHILAKNWDSKVYHSTDFGVSWTIVEQYSAKNFSSIYQSPIDKNLVIFGNYQGTSWISEDCGTTLKAIVKVHNISKIQFHPLERSWILASVDPPRSDPPGSIYVDFLDRRNLYVSKDLGKTWTFILKDVQKSSWGMQDPSFSANVPKQRIIISHVIEKSENGLDYTSFEIAYSDDFFNTKMVLVGGFDPWTSEVDFFVDVNYLVVWLAQLQPKNFTLYSGSSNASKYKLDPINLPKHSTYRILDSSEGQIWLYARNQYPGYSEWDSDYGDLYISDSTGLRYTLSVPNNSATEYGQLSKVLGLEGVYITNLSPRRSSGYDKDYMTAKISFDKGDTWESIKPPQKNFHGADVKCENEEQCFLHLLAYDAYSSAQPIYSVKSSPRIIMGNGQIGKNLSPRREYMNTYLSRDSGYTWFEVLLGCHKFTIGDHGAIIIAIPCDKSTQYIQYSLNEGLTWEELQISDEVININEVVIEPSNTAEYFIVHGSFNNKTVVAISLDFANVYTRKCELVSEPNDKNSDYETWTTTKSVNNHSLNGHEITYVHRKAESQCFNREKWSSLYSFKNCECKEEDWECDIGYERVKNGQCESKNKSLPSHKPPSESECYGGYYVVAQGYKKRGGNTCEGGVSYEPIKYPCPNKGGENSKAQTEKSNKEGSKAKSNGQDGGLSKTQTLVLLALSFLLLGCFCFWFYKRYLTQSGIQKPVDSTARLMEKPPASQKQDLASEDPERLMYM